MSSLSNELVQYGADIGDLGIDAVRAVCREVLAYREAAGKPVVWIGNRMLDDMVGEGGRTCGRVWSSDLDELSNERRIPLYVAPKLPGIVGWINEDELPENYPYDQMFPFSKVDVVRMFPVCAPQLTAVPDGFVLVPIGPTKDMLDAGNCYIEDGFSDLDKAYKAMIGSAPTPTSDTVTDNSPQQFESLARGSSDE